jgi:DNA-binding transcriptional ArsR family regulator
VDEADLRLLAFAAEHRLVLAAHAQTLLGISARAAGRHLRVLAETGLLRSERRLAGRGWYQIDRAGLAAIGSSLSRPRDVDLATYEHDIGLAWLWLAADRGALGATRALVSERQMRSADRRAERFSEPYGVRVPGAGPRGGERRHYPDLVLETVSGHRVAIELELSSKSPSRREEILGGYAIEARFDAVLYLVDRPEVGRAIERSAAAVGVSDLVHVQPVAFGPGAGGISRGRTGERADGRINQRTGARADQRVGARTDQRVGARTDQRRAAGTGGPAAGRPVGPSAAAERG